MISNTQTNDRIGDAILAAISAEITKIADEEADAAAERVRVRTRGRIAEMALTLFDHFSIERIGRDLKIIVKHEGTNA